MLVRYLTFSVVFILFAFTVFRIIIKRDYKNRNKLSPVSYLLEILIFAIHINSIYIILPTEWPDLPPIPENQVLRIVSIIIFGSGIAILLFSWFSLGTKPSLGMDKNELKTSGLYHYSRNPQLLGYGIMLFAFVILFFSWLTLLWFLLYILISYFMVKSEEEFLERNYGEEYRDYCIQVPRIIKLKK